MPSIHPRSAGSETPVQPLSRSARSGFSLVIALSLMAFILVLLLSITAFVRVESVNAEQSTERLLARANAMLAMQTALGELQKATGPDRRITATADILSTDGYLGADRSDDKRYWTGAWSTEAYLANDLANRSRPPRTLNPEEDLDLDAAQSEGFERWLVSSPDPSLVENATDATGAYDADTELELLVGPGTINGSAAANPDDFYVSAPTVRIDATDPNSGKIAWWVGDQGVKARIDRADPNRDSTIESERLQSLRAGQRSGLELFSNRVDADAATTGDFLPLDPANQEPQRAAAKLHATSGLSLADPDLSPAGDYRFHDASLLSEGLLTDVKFGGLRRDLSLAFEMPLTAFQTQPEFGNGYDAISIDTGGNAIRDMGFDVSPLFEFSDFDNAPAVSGTAVARGPTWNLLRSHYRLYKNNDTDRAAYGYWSGKNLGDLTRDASGLIERMNLLLGFPKMKPNSSQQGYLGHRYGYDTPAALLDRGDTSNEANLTGGTSRPLTTRLVPEIAPIITRFAFFISVKQANNGGLAFMFDPVVVAWNPYNVELEFALSGSDELLARYQNLPMEVTVLFDNVEPSSVGTGPFKNTFTLSQVFGSQIRPSLKGRSETVRLDPGELRIFSMDGQTRTGNYWGQTDIFDNGLQYAYQSQGGLLKRLDLQAGGESISLTPDSRIAVAFTWEPGAHAYFNLYQELGGYSAVVSQSVYAPLDGDAIADGAYSESGFDGADTSGTLYWPEPNAFSLADGDEGDYIAQNNFKYYSAGGGSPYVGDITTKDSIGVVDLYLKAAAESDYQVQMLNHYNPRSPVPFPGYRTDGADIESAGAYETADPWRIKFFRIQDWIGTSSGGLTGLNGYWGEDHTVGDDRVVLFEVPSRPLLSIGALQHADINMFVDQPAFAIGNSYPSPFIPTDKVHRTTSLPVGSYTRVDTSYLANEALWDSYFFSGLAEDIPPFNQSIADRWTAFVAGDRESPGGNADMIRSRSAESLDTDPTEALLDGGNLRPEAYRRIAAFLGNKGAFNINSTSIEAWRNVLGSTNDLAVPTASGADDNGQGVALSRLGRPAEGSLEGGASDWRGFRRLDENEIDDLARAIVAEVKRRGPFVSLADFVNRRLGAGNDTARSGTLQAAIDATQINDHLNASFQAGAADTSVFIRENADFLSASTGATTYLSQADLLQTIGPRLSARSDTFIIRAYGEAPSRLDSDEPVNAICEAVVQRSPAYVNPGDNYDTPSAANPTFNDPVNRAFGRRYEVVMFRWLEPDEI